MLTPTKTIYLVKASSYIVHFHVELEICYKGKNMFYKGTDKVATTTATYILNKYMSLAWQTFDVIDKQITDLTHTFLRFDQKHYLVNVFVKITITIITFTFTSTVLVGFGLSFEHSA